MINKEPTYYFFLGIGGIGMSALARYFKHLGKEVLGYDKTETALTKSLTNEGVAVFYSDDRDNIPASITPNNTQVVITPAIKQLSLLDYFTKQGFAIKKRSEVLGMITNNTYNVSVAGTHGKTTTTAIIGHIFKELNLKSTAFLGGIAQNYHSNLILNGDEISVTEADEFDRSFLTLKPNIGIITSTDADHLDVYGKASELEKSFQAFANLVSDCLLVKKGLAIPNATTYAVQEKADFYATNIHINNAFYHFDLIHPKGTIKDCHTQLAGIHNVENAVAAMAVALTMNLDPTLIKQALASFNGVWRRFNRWYINNKVYIDDYAHHPTEINAVAKSIKTLYPNHKSLCIFQPHLYSRTKDFANEFAKSLQAFNHVILLEIYPAREQPIPGITSDWLASKINKQVQVASLDNLLELIHPTDHDVILTLGAGNIDTMVQPIKDLLYAS